MSPIQIMVTAQIIKPKIIFEDKIDFGLAEISLF